MKTVDELKALTKSGLIEYAADFGIELDKNLSNAALLQSFLDKGGTVKTAAASVAPKGSKRVLITVHGGNGSDGESDVFVSVNGRVIRIKRNVKVAILPEYVEALEHAVQTLFSTEGVGLEAKMVGRQVPTYPFTVHGPA